LERTYDSNRDAHVEPPLILSGTTTENLNESNHLLGSDEEHASSRRAFLGAMMVSTGLVVANSLSPEAACALEASPNNINNKSDNQRMSSASTTTLLSDAAAAVAPPVDWQSIFQKASKKALGGGKAGASAAVVQVCSLMWLRTSMNYQYRYGGNLQSSLKKLWDEGGVARLYQGLPFALVQGPMTRFGDTAANVGILALLETLPGTQEWPLPLKTACGSAAAGLWRIVLSEYTVRWRIS